MSLDDLKAYVVFSEMLNFTHAAEKLSISQPALFVKIKKLSEALGAPLYTKSGRRLSLTAQGKELARFGRETLRAKEQFLGRFRGDEQHSTVTLAAGSGSYLYLLGSAIKSFKRESKHKLNLLTANRPQSVEALRSGRTQLAVTVIQDVPHDLESEIICRVPAKLVVQSSHHLAEAKRIRPKDLLGEEFILPPAGSPFRETLSTYFQQNDIDWKIALEASGWELMMQFVSLGLGVTVVNGCCRVPDDCVSVPIPWLPAANYALLRLKNTKLAPGAKELHEFIVQTTHPDATVTF